MSIVTGSRPLPSLLSRIDRVWLAIAVLVALLAVTVPAQALASLRFVAASLIHTAPYLIASIAIAAAAKASGADNLIARAFIGRTVGAIVLAAIFGGLSPFCSCGV
ncbi:MAG: hypothetical protein KDJ16_03545, partial [Hyphomicrobiales bacterium]|nr:hypothetical protein [Hyphomicrobiales bacterium]